MWNEYPASWKHNVFVFNKNEKTIDNELIVIFTNILRLIIFARNKRQLRFYNFCVGNLIWKKATKRPVFKTSRNRFSVLVHRIRVARKIWFKRGKQTGGCYLFEMKIRLCLAVSTDLLHVERMLILVLPLSVQVMVRVRSAGGSRLKYRRHRNYRNRHYWLRRTRAN